MIGRSLALALVIAVLFVVAGCGAASVQPAGQPSTSNLDELQHRLAEQEVVIQNRLGPPRQKAGQPLDQVEGSGQAPIRGGAGGEAAPPRQAVRPAQPEAAPGKAVESQAPASGYAQGAAAGSTCDLVCRALASMRRSADRICEIVGTDDARCSQARDRVADAARRVAGAGCSCDSR